MDAETKGTEDNWSMFNLGTIIPLSTPTNPVVGPVFKYTVECSHVLIKKEQLSLFIYTALEVFIFHSAVI